MIAMDSRSIDKLRTSSAGMTKPGLLIRAIRLLFVCFVIQRFFCFGCGYAALCFREELADRIVVVEIRRTAAW